MTRRLVDDDLLHLRERRIEEREAYEAFYEREHRHSSWRCHLRKEVFVATQDATDAHERSDVALHAEVRIADCDEVGRILWLLSGGASRARERQEGGERDCERSTEHRRSRDA